MESCAISRRATVLGRKRWVLAVCLVRAAGHCPCSAPLSGMPLGIVVVVVCCHCRHRTVHCHYRTMPAIIVALCLLAVPLAVVACRRHRRHASSSSSSPCIIVVVITMHHCRRSVIILLCPVLLCTVTALLCRCHAAGSAIVVSLRRRYCTVSVIMLLGVIAMVPLGTVVAPSSHRRAHCRRC